MGQANQYVPTAIGPGASLDFAPGLSHSASRAHGCSRAEGREQRTPFRRSLLTLEFDVAATGKKLCERLHQPEAVGSRDRQALTARPPLRRVKNSPNQPHLPETPRKAAFFSGVGQMSAKSSRRRLTLSGS